MILRDSVYVQIHRGYLTVKSRRILREITKQCSGLTHPRTVLGDFNEVVETLREAFKELYRGKVIRPRLTALVHIVPEVEGGFTPVELRGFRELAAQAGAVRVYLLTDHPVLTLKEQRDLAEFM